MEPIPIALDQDLVALLEELQRPARQAARELIVLELYRQGKVSSGRVAQLLGMEREEFIRYASEQGIPYFQLEGEELQRELEAIIKLWCPSHQTPVRSSLSLEFSASISFRPFSGPF